MVTLASSFLKKYFSILHLLTSFPIIIALKNCISNRTKIHPRGLSNDLHILVGSKDINDTVHNRLLFSTQ